VGDTEWSQDIIVLLCHPTLPIHLVEEAHLHRVVTFADARLGLHTSSRFVALGPVILILARASTHHTTQILVENIDLHPACTILKTIYLAIIRELTRLLPHRMRFPR
jgi:hypothetical protein